MKNIATFLFAVTLLTACSKKEADPQPASPQAPVQAATINMAFDYYAVGNSPASTESLSLLATKPVYKMYSDRLEVNMQAVNSAGFVQDRILLTIPLSRQKAGLVGTYTLASQPDASLGEMLVNYTRPSNSSSAYDNVYSSNSARVEGSFTLAAYDASRHIISGSYTVKFLNVKGPFSFVDYSSTGDPRRNGDLRLNGSFQELPLN